MDRASVGRAGARSARRPVSGQPSAHQSGGWSLGPLRESRPANAKAQRTRRFGEAAALAAALASGSASAETSALSTRPDRSSCSPCRSTAAATSPPTGPCWRAPGPYFLVVPVGTYRVGVFADRNHSLAYDAGEPAGWVQDGLAITRPAGRHDGGPQPGAATGAAPATPIAVALPVRGETEVDSLPAGRVGEIVHARRSTLLRRERPHRLVAAGRVSRRRRRRHLLPRAVRPDAHAGAVRARRARPSGNFRTLIASLDKTPLPGVGRVLSDAPCASTSPAPRSAGGCRPWRPSITSPVSVSWPQHGRVGGAGVSQRRSRRPRRRARRARLRHDRHALAGTLGGGARCRARASAWRRRGSTGAKRRCPACSNRTASSA